MEGIRPAGPNNSEKNDEGAKVPFQKTEGQNLESLASEWVKYGGLPKVRAKTYDLRHVVPKEIPVQKKSQKHQDSKMAELLKS